MQRFVRALLFAIVLAFIFAVAAAQAVIPTAQRDALVAFYDATGGPQWTNRSGWLGAPGTECAWFGITCDESGATVTEIYFDDNNLTGTIPATALGNLPDLRVLGLIRGAMTGAIPPQLGSLAHLEALWLQVNQFSGAIPTELGALSNLAELDLSANALDGSIPSSLGNLPHLERLALGGNPLTGPIPPSLGNDVALFSLELNDAQLSGSIPDALFRLPALTFLSLSNNALTGPIPTSVGAARQLYSLLLDGNQLTGSIPRELGTLPSLVELVLAGNQFTGGIPAELANLDLLIGLDLSGNPLGGTIPPQLGNLRNLAYFHAWRAKLTGTIPPELGNLTNLYDLTLWENELTGTIPTTLAHLNNLQSLSLAANRLTGPVPGELAQLTHLQSLDLGGNLLSGTIPAQLGNLSELQSLDLSDNDLEGSIPAELGRATSLRYLVLRLNRFSGSIPAALGQLPNLDALILSYNRLTGSIPPQLGNLAELTHLDLAENQLSGTIPPELGNLAKMDSLFLTWNQLTGPIPPELGRLSSLTFLALTGNHLSGVLPPQIAGWSSMALLFLDYNSFSGAIPDAFASMPLLGNLQLGRNAFGGAIPASLGTLRYLTVLGLSVNQLRGEIPSQLAALPLENEGLDLNYNALWTSNPGLRTWLNSRQWDHDFEATQTVTPRNLAVSGTTGSSVILTWERIRYSSDDGGYEIEVSRNGSVVATLTTGCKELTAWSVTGLAPLTTYSFRIRTVSYAHDDQQSTIASDWTASVSGTTSTASPQPPLIVVDLLPWGMVQAAGSGGAADFFVLTNYGDAETTVTLTPSGGFFTVDAASATIGPQESGWFTITGLARSAGAYRGSIALSGAGVRSGLAVPVTLLSTLPPAGSVIAEAAVTKVEIVAPEGVVPKGEAAFTNRGTAPLSGIATADVPWIVPAEGIVSIASGATAKVPFTIDRTQRPDAANLEGAATGNLMLVYANGQTQSAPKLVAERSTGRLPGRGNDASPPSASVSIVTVVDTVQAGATAAPIPPLAPNEVALIVPGVSALVSGGRTTVADVGVANVFGSGEVRDLRAFFGAAGPSALTSVSNVRAVAPGQAVRFANVVKSVFGRDGQSGVLWLRTSDPASLAVFARLDRASAKEGSVGTVLPVFRSDRSAAAGQEIVLPGVRGDDGYLTDLYLQETAGSAASAAIVFLDAAGTNVGPARAADAIAPFSLLQLTSIVPAGAVTAVVTVSGSGRVAAYAVVTDKATGDPWIVTDWSRMLDFYPTAPQLVPVAGTIGSPATASPRRRAVPHGSVGERAGGAAASAVSRTGLALFNRGTKSAAATLSWAGSGGAVEKTVTLTPRQTLLVDDAAAWFGRTGSGRIALEPLSGGSFALTSRTWIARSGGTVSSAVPVVSAKTGLRRGQTRTLGGIDDSRLSAARDATPGTWSSALLFVETSGAPLKIRASLTYSDAKSVVIATGTAVRDFAVGAGESLYVPNVGAAILGSAREAALGDLRNVLVRLQATDGDGAVVVLLQSTENASGDVTWRWE